MRRRRPATPASCARVEGSGPTRLWLRLAGGVLVAVLGTLLLVKVVGGSNGERTTTDLSPTSAVVLAEVTHVPASVFDDVGVELAWIVPIVAAEPPPRCERADGASQDGARLPWSSTWARSTARSAPRSAGRSCSPSRGSGRSRPLYDMQSSPTDFAPNTPTFTFYRAKYSSTYVVFHAYEVDSDVLTTKGYVALMHLPRHVRRLLRPLDPTMTYPIVDFANLVVVHQANLEPDHVRWLSRDQIASGLTDPANPVTRSRRRLVELPDRGDLPRRRCAAYVGVRLASGSRGDPRTASPT